MKNNYSIVENVEKYAAFTLAEILITLAITGIIAALTIPALVQNSRERITVTKIEKFYTDINQAMLRAVDDNGDVTGWDYSGQFSYAAKDTKDTDVFADIFKKYIKFTKDCSEDEGSNNTDCIPADNILMLNNSPRNENGHNLYAEPRYRKLLLGTGGLIWLRTNTQNEGKCKDSLNGYTNVCGELFYDINGKNKPNTLGLDIFVFEILPDKIVPVPEDNACKNASQSGWGCSGYIIKHGNMNYLYNK